MFDFSDVTLASEDDNDNTDNHRDFYVRVLRVF